VVAGCSRSIKMEPANRGGLFLVVVLGLDLLLLLDSGLLTRAAMK
jgi:hypothetical protein